MNKFLIIFVLQLNFLWNYAFQSSYYKNTLKIGLLFDHGDPNIKKVFEKSIELANRELKIPMQAVVTDVNYADSFDASRKLNDMLNDNVAVIFGPSAKNSAKHVIEVCDYKEIPFLDTRWDYTQQMKSLINIYPHPKQIASALRDIIFAYEWKKFVLLYESGEYLPIINELFELRQDGFSMRVLRYDLQLDGNYRSVLRILKKSDDNLVLVVGSSKTLGELFKQAQQIGIINDQYQYIIGNLDLQYLDLEQYRYSEVNITGIRIFSPDDVRIQKLIQEISFDEEYTLNGTSMINMEMAMLYDGINLFSEALKKFIEIPTRKITPLSRGLSLLNDIATSNTHGLTGNIRFDREGFRTEFSLEIIELSPSGLTRIGYWNDSIGLSLQRLPQSIVIDDNKTLTNKSFIVLTAINPPYGILKSSFNQLSGNDRYEGFGIELIDKLSKKLGFNYTIKLLEGSGYGGFNVTTNQTTGMMKEIADGRADMAITDLTITANRELVVDFTIPFMNLGISILYRKPRKEPPKLFSFMDPFSSEVWLYLGLAYVGVSLSLFILGRISPTEWDNPYPCTEDPDQLENQFSFANSMWFTTGALLQQGSEIAPKAPSTRVVASIWWFFTIIMVSSYTANLAAFLTVDSTYSPVENVQQLSENRGGVKYGAKKTGSTMDFFQNSSEPIYQKMYDYMQSHPELLMENNEDGVAKAQNENYAYLMESTSIEYHIERKCDLRQVGGLLDAKGYGIAVKKNSPYRPELTNAILELQEAGELERMTNKWWREIGAGQCSKKKVSEGAEKMGMPNLGGVYFVLFIGSILAAFYGILEWIFFMYHTAHRYKTSVKDEFIRELKFALNFSQNIKQVKSTTELTYSRNSSVTMDSLEIENCKNFSN